MMALKVQGVSKVYVVDLMQKRLDKAMELGATDVINASKEDVLEAIKTLTNVPELPVFKTELTDV